MKVNIIISSDYIREDLIKDKVVVIIDILRATSVITTAFMNGCKELVPVLTVEEAFEMKKNDSECILGGERHAIKVDGFDLSNSPLEYTKEVVSGKRIILSTTNGTRAITSCGAADKILIGSMLNANALAYELVKLGKDVVLVNSGTYGEFSMDDFICSGYIVSRILEKANNVELADIATAALKTYEDHSDILSYVKEARHYERMKSLGLMEDIYYCIQKDKSELIIECIHEKGLYTSKCKHR